MSVVSTCSYSVGSNAIRRPSLSVLPLGPGQIGGEQEALARDDLRPRGSSRAARAGCSAIVCCGPCPGASPLGWTVRSRANALVELVGDRLQEARAEAVDGDDQRQADQERGRGRGGPARIRARGVGREPPLDREDACAPATRAPAPAAGSRTARRSRSRRRSRSCRSSRPPRRPASSPRRRPARTRRRGPAAISATPEHGPARARPARAAPRCRARRGSATSSRRGGRGGARRGRP